MRTVTLINTPSGQIVTLPDDMSYKDIDELEVHREGDVITLRPVLQQRRSIADSLAMPGNSDFELEPLGVKIKIKPANFT